MNKSVVPLDTTDQHSNDKLECNVSKVVTSKPKKNRESKYGPNKTHASKHAINRSKKGTLVDRGANGGMLGNDAKVIFKCNKTSDVTGIDNHELNALPMVDATAKTVTDKGPVILILRNYAYHGLNRTLHSAGQIEWHQNKAHNTSMKVGRRQVIKTVDGYYIPINIIRGLPCMQMEPNAAEEFETLPHVMLTQGGEWDPTASDHTLTDDDVWVSKVKHDEDQEYDSPFDNRGESKHREPVRAGVPIENPTGPPSEDPDNIEVNFHKGNVEVNFHADDATREVHQAYQEVSNLNKIFVHEGEGMPDDEVETVEEEEDETKEDIEANTPPVETKPKPVDYSKCQRQFLHVPVEKIKRAFAATTQNAASIVHGPNVNQTLKSPNPALNIRQRKEAVATDSLFADVPTVDTPGYTGAQIFVGTSSLLTDCYGFCSVSEFPNALLDNIGERGAMDTLISDHANYEMSARVKDILRSLMIGHWKSEPCYQHQNFAEHRWGHVKSNLEWLLAFLDVNPDCWLLALNYVCSVMI